MAGAVVDDDGVAGEVEIAGQHDAAGVRRFDRRARRDSCRSAPPCGWRSSPLKTDRTPNEEITELFTGMTNRCSHNGAGADFANTAASRTRSRSMRASAAFGGRTKRGSTFSVRVGNVFLPPAAFQFCDAR